MRARSWSPSGVDDQKARATFDRSLGELRRYREQSE
jgi:hypothetical protein